MIHLVSFGFPKGRFRSLFSSEGASGNAVPEARKPGKTPLLISVIIIVIIAFAAGLNYLQTSSVISNQNSTISSLNKQVTSLDNQVSSLNNQVSTDQNQINSLQGQVSSDEGLISNLNQMLSADNLTIVSDRAKITSLNNSYLADQTEINTLDGQITALNSKINAYSSQVSSLQNQTIADQSKLSKLQNILDLTNTTILDNSESITLNTGYVWLWNFSVPYAGYFTIDVISSTSSNTEAAMFWSAEGASYVNVTDVGSSGSVIYPVLPNSETIIIVGDQNFSAMSATVTIKYTS